MAEQRIRELEARIAELEQILAATITSYNAIIERLQAENADLKRKLGTDSNNSSKPPSSDGYKKKPKSLRKAGGKTGGQPGHKGKTLELSETADEIVIHEVCRCDKCCADLKDTPVLDMERRQVFEVPPIRLNITEHRAEIKKCACGEITKADFPQGVNSRVQYGDSVTSLLTYWNVMQFIPYERCVEMFAEMTGYDISEGTLFACLNAANEAVKPHNKAISRQLSNSEVGNADETGIKVKGKNMWLHSFSNERWTLYHVHKRRGKEAMIDMGILQDYKGVVVHDFLKSYFTFDGVTHAMCCAHLLRECQGIIDNTCEGGEWAKEMQNLLRLSWHKVKEARAGGEQLLDEDTRKIGDEYDKIVDIGNLGVQNILAPRVKTDAINLLKRFAKYRDDILRFLNNANIPFDNNQAERDIRMVKVKTKVSGSFRTLEGAKQFASIRGFVSTLRKQGLGVLKSLEDALKGSFSFEGC